MFEKSVFSNLRKVRDDARRVMNLAFNDKGRSVDKLHDKLEELNHAWSQVESARSKMDSEWDIIQRLKNSSDTVWREYRKQQENYSREIDYAKSQQEYYHQESQRLFQRSRDAYNFGDKSRAPYYSQQAKVARSKRDDWANEVGRLISNSKSLPKPNNSISYSSHDSARQDYLYRKGQHAKIKSEYDAIKSEHAENLRRFNQYREEFFKAKKAVDDYREKAKKESENRRKEDSRQRDRMIEIGREAIRLVIAKPDLLWKYYTSDWEEQHIDSDCKVMVRSSYSKKFNKRTIEIMVIDKTGGVRDGRHWHSGYDEYGNEIFGHWKNKTGVENVRR